jgi:histidinol-phosphate aminotransferase
MSPNIRPAVTSSPDYPFSAINAPIKLDQNESSEDFPQNLKLLALERIASHEWNRYPDLNSEALCDAIGRHDGWAPSGIVVTTGSNVLISLLIQLTALDSRVVTVKPNFALYGLDAQLLGADLTEIPLLSDFNIDVEGVLKSLEDSGQAHDRPRGVIYVPRPHAPTGTIIALNDLDRLIAYASDWLVVVDEAYHHFADGDALGLASKYSNVVVIRTFSKAWGLAGVRMGYALTSDSIAKQLRKLVPPFAISCMQSECVQVALEYPEYLNQRVARTKLERDRMTTALMQHPSWKVFPSGGNFILIRTLDARAAYEGLFKQGVLVRRQDSYFGLEGCIRVTVGTVQENDAFLRAAFLLA